MTSSHNVDKIMRIPQFKDSDQFQSEELDSVLDNLEGIENKFYLSFQRMNDAFKLLRRKMEDEVTMVSTVQVVESSPPPMVLEGTKEPCERDNQRRRNSELSFDGEIDQETIVPTTSSETECSLDHMGLQDSEELCERDNQRRRNFELSFDGEIDQETIVPTTSSETECSLDHMGLQDSEDLCERDNRKRKNIESSFETTTTVVKSVETEHAGEMEIQKPTKVERREIEQKIVQLERMMDRKFYQILNAFQQTIEKAH